MIGGFNLAAQLLGHGLHTVTIPSTGTPVQILCVVLAVYLTGHCFGPPDNIMPWSKVFNFVIAAFTGINFAINANLTNTTGD